MPLLIPATSDVSPSLHFPVSPESNWYQHHRQLSATALACAQRRQWNQSLAPRHIHRQVKPRSHPPMSASRLPNLRHHQLRRLWRSPRQLHSLNWSIWWQVFWTPFVSHLRTLRPNHQITSWNDFIHSQRQLPPSCAEDALYKVVYQQCCIRRLADCLQGFVGELTDPNDPNATDEQLNGICSYYSTLLDISI